MSKALRMTMITLAAALANAVFIPSNAPELVFSGRTLNTGGHRRFDWPGVRILFHVHSTRNCFILLNETQTNRYAVLVGGGSNGSTWSLHNHFTAVGNGGRYPVFTDRDEVPIEGDRNVMIVKTTEACGTNTGCDWGVFGTASFIGLEIDLGAQLLPVVLPWRAGRRLLFLGDSITAGWGARGNTSVHSTQACNDDEDHWQAWGPSLSRLLEAEYHSIAWGGVGLIRGDDAGTPLNRSLPALMGQTLANEPLAPAWDNSQWPASAVLVHIGTNDFCPKFAPMDHTTFVGAYLQLLMQVKNKQRPGGESLDVFAACGPMGTQGDPEYGHPYFPCDVLEPLAAQGAVKGLRIHLLQFSGLFEETANLGGCAHPGVSAHAAMASIAHPIVKAALGW